MIDLELAKLFHDTYEKLAPTYGYETRSGTKIFDPASPNGKLMIAVCKIILTRLVKTKYGLTEKDWYYGDDVKI